MKKLFLLASCFNLFCSCGGSEKKEQKQEKERVEATEVNHVFDTLGFRELPLPLAIDTSFVDKADSSLRLTYSHIRSMSNNFFENELCRGMAYDLNTFCEIDSLKKINKYKEYVERLDIGMTKNCIAYKIGYCNLPDSCKMYVWGMQTKSYEACPFYEGRFLIATLVNAKGEGKHALVAERSGGGDPPSMANTDMTSDISRDGNISVKRILVMDDLDTPGNVIATETVKLSTSGGNFSFSDYKKEEKNTEKENRKE